MEKILYLAEGMGLYTKGITKKQRAVDEMRKEVAREYALYVKIGQEWDYPFTAEDITEDTVKETRYFQHRSCSTETVGDDQYCYDCGEICGTSGRKTFVFIR